MKNPLLADADFLADVAQVRAAHPLNPASVAAGVPPAVKPGILPGGIPLPDLASVAAGVPPAVEPGILPGGIPRGSYPVPRSLPSDAPLHLWWLGQSGFLLEYAGQFLLLDPYLSDSLTRKYAATDKPHVRITRRVVDPARLDFIAAVTSSHNHTDHLDPETLQSLVLANPSLIALCPEANRNTVRERSTLPVDRILGFDVSPEDASAHRIPTPRPVPGTSFLVAPVPAAHETLERDHAGRLIYLGFIVHAGPYRIYHSGDTLRFDGMAEMLRGASVDVALLPINGRAPERRVAGNLSGREAAELAHAIGARCVVPCHYDMFEFNTASPDEFVAACQAFGQPYQVLQQGQRLQLDPRSVTPGTSPGRSETTCGPLKPDAAQPPGEPTPSLRS